MTDKMPPDIEQITHVVEAAVFQSGFRDEIAKLFLTSLLNDPAWRGEMEIDARKYNESQWAHLFASRAYMMADAMWDERTRPWEARQEKYP